MFNYVFFPINQFAKSVVSQAHLCPLPLHVCPVYWAYDCGLRLYPLPDLVVCADKFDPFVSTNTDCTVMNPVRNFFLRLNVTCTLVSIQINGVLSKL